MTKQMDPYTIPAKMEQIESGEWRISAKTLPVSATGSDFGKAIYNFRDAVREFQTRQMRLFA